MFKQSKHRIKKAALMLQLPTEASIEEIRTHVRNDAIPRMKTTNYSRIWIHVPGRIINADGEEVTGKSRI